MKKIITAAVTVASVASLVVVPMASAANTANSQLTQVINAGTLSTSITNAAGAPVSNPVFAMGAVAASTSQQTSNGTFGSDSQRIMVDNPGGANNGWTLTLNATTPGTGKWTSGSNNYAYNGTAATGQMTVNPAGGSYVALTGTSTGVTLGASSAFSGTAAVTLANASAASDDFLSGYLRNIPVTQTIPAGQAIGTYTIDMTQTITAV